MGQIGGVGGLLDAVAGRAGVKSLETVVKTAKPSREKV
jgi:hypothetical protein